MIAENTRIMPMTVPSRPSRGAMPAIVPRVFRNRSSSWTTWRPVSSTASLMTSRGRCRFSNAAARTRPRADWARNFWMCRRSSSCRAAHSSTISPTPSGTTTLRRKDQKRSRMIARASVEHSRIGAISQPPARMISSMRTNSFGRRMRESYRKHPAEPISGPAARHGAT